MKNWPAGIGHHLFGTRAGGGAAAERERGSDRLAEAGGTAAAVSSRRPSRVVLAAEQQEAADAQTATRPATPPMSSPVLLLGWVVPALSVAGPLVLAAARCERPDA